MQRGVRTQEQCAENSRTGLPQKKVRQIHIEAILATFEAKMRTSIYLRWAHGTRAKG
jgi:hypothetical protein